MAAVVAEVVGAGEGDEVAKRKVTFRHPLHVAVGPHAVPPIRPARAASMRTTRCGDP